LAVLIKYDCVGCVDQIWLCWMCWLMVGVALSIDGGCVGCVNYWRLSWSRPKVAVSAVLIVDGCVGCVNQWWLRLCQLLVNWLAVLIDGGCSILSAVHMACCSVMLSFHLLLLQWCYSGRYFFGEKDTSHRWRQHKCQLQQGAAVSADGTWYLVHLVPNGTMYWWYVGYLVLYCSRHSSTWYP